MMNVNHVFILWLVMGCLSTVLLVSAQSDGNNLETFPSVLPAPSSVFSFTPLPSVTAPSSTPVGIGPVLPPSINLTTAIGSGTVSTSSGTTTTSNTSIYLTTTTTTSASATPTMTTNTNTVTTTTSPAPTTLSPPTIAGTATTVRSMPIIVSLAMTILALFSGF